LRQCSPLWAIALFKLIDASVNVTDLADQFLKAPFGDLLSGCRAVYLL